MSILTKSIDYFVDALLAGDDDLVHTDAADAFIAQHRELIDLHVEELVRRQIVAAIKARSQVPAPPLGQGVLFKGLPAAVTISDGVTRPIARCTRGDLALGREMKVENISAARAALKAYDADVQRLLPLMPDDTTTVGSVVHLLSESS